MAIFNCGLYEDFCDSIGPIVYPEGRLYKGDDVIVYEGEKKTGGFVDFINEKCGAQRGMDGNLNDDAGRILSDDVRRIVSEFKGGGDRAKLVAEMKAIPGADVYVKAMERIIANGDATIAADVAKMEDVIRQRKGAVASIDGVKKRLNVFREFLPERPDL
jgi:hypothetical protein